MGWRQAAVVANLVIIQGPGEGMFSYSPTVGAGNLVASTGIARAGTDPYGNVYLAGDTTYAQSVPPGAFLAEQVWQSGITWWSSTTEAGPWTQQASITRTGYTSDLLTLTGSLGLQTAEIWLAPTGDTSGVSDASRITGAYIHGYSVVHLLPGTFYVRAGSVVLGLGQYLFGAGKTATLVNVVDNGAGLPGVQITNAGAYVGTKSAGVGRFTLSGGGTTQSNGLQVGNIAQLLLDDLLISNFIGAGTLLGSSGKGLYLLNDVTFTEQAHGSLLISNCTAGVAFDAAGAGTNSFERASLDVWLNMHDGQDGVQFLGSTTGTQINFSRLALRGNFAAGAGGGHVINIQGSGSGGIFIHLDVDVECNGAGTGPQTINFQAGSFLSGYGSMNFLNAGSPFVQSNNLGQFFFTGPTSGDATLNAQQFYGAWVQGAIVNGDTLVVNRAAVVRVAPAGAVTGIILAPGTQSGQVAYVVNESANSITFAVPATSHVADGATAALAAGTARGFVWDTGTALWYRMA